MSVVYYNVNCVREIYLGKNPRYEMFIKKFLSDTPSIFYEYDNIGMNKNCVYDRTGGIKHYLDISNEHPIPDATGFSKDFHTISEERAKSLLSLNKPIKVLWSGGIDSTYALFLLNHYANDKSQVKAYGTYVSIMESEGVFDKFIKDKMPYEICVAPTLKDKKILDDSIWVTGFQGNQLFGPTDNFFSHNKDVALFHHTLGNKDTIYESYEKHIDPKIIEFLKPAIQNSPRKIETINDLRWYCIFNLDWYTGLYEVKAEMSIEKQKTIHHFFDTEDFQRWAITTKEPFTKVKGKPNTHRWQMRDRLFDFGLTDYAKNKSKSISSFSTLNPCWLLLENNGKNIYI
jgi:hypothetical protein